MMKEPKPPANMTNEEGIILANETIRIIKEDPEPRHFVSSVLLDVIGMRARLKDGAYFTQGMEQTLKNWSKAIGPGNPPGEKKEMVQ